MAYELKLDTYQGPLDKLLELIEQKAMPITEVSLSAVTDDFLQYLETLAEIQPAVLADFIVVASRLLLIKSKSLLPELALTAEEEEDIKDLERRLEFYRNFKTAERHLKRLWKMGGAVAARPYMDLAHLRAFSPGGNLTSPGLAAAIGRVYADIQKFVLDSETISEVIVSLEEKMADIVKRMASLETSTLARLAGGSPSPYAKGLDKRDIIVLFLALLHLAREQMLVLEQGERFSDIMVRKMTGAARSGHPESASFADEGTPGAR